MFYGLGFNNFMKLKDLDPMQEHYLRAQQFSQTASTTEARQYVKILFDEEGIEKPNH